MKQSRSEKAGSGPRRVVPLLPGSLTRMVPGTGTGTSASSRTAESAAERKDRRDSTALWLKNSQV